ncbi:MAG: 4Fe-4S dicluster domain-containing protein [Desulfomonile tiedjei]|nr:4Fe-4S dicluster domain-containing protein [Desulfomonile tiedjei]
MDQRELRDLENRCIQEWAPWCTATCPVHVDVRAMCAALSEGNFSAAAKILHKSVPFPGIISRICDHPCEPVCKRREVGEAISIRALERAALAWSAAGDAKVAVLPRKNKRVAVIGGGLSGLTAMLDLTKKGYQIVLFEVADRLGGTVWEYPEYELPRDVIARDLKVLENLQVDVRLNTAGAGDLSIPDLLKDFDAVYLGTGRNNPEGLGVELNSSGLISANTETFDVGMAGVFAGGSVVRGRANYSPIRSISDGRRAAISIDRFLQGVSLTASRENEGSYDTRLFTSTVGVEPLDRIPMADRKQGYSEDEATREAGRCLQCECMECVKVCEFLSDFKGYPKKYIRQVYNNLSIVMGQRHGNKLINSCSICGLCKEVCPEDLHMGEVCKEARRTMVTQGKMPPSAHEFALLDMEFSNGEKSALTRHQPGMNSSAFVLFPGCQLSGSSPGNVRKTYAYLTQHLDGGVGLMLRCCGAPADWAGREEAFAEVISEFEAEWAKMGKAQLIIACSTCYSVFKTRLPHVPVQSVWDVLDRFELPARGLRPQSVTVAVHDPCTSRHEKSMQDSVRSILRKLGCKIRELPLSRDRTECCGYGGLMCFSNRELADRVTERRVAASPDHYLAYCMMCRDRFRAKGKPSWHLLDLIFGPEGLDEPARRSPDYSQRRENRARLKNTLLTEVWSEEVDERQEQNAVRLNISEHVRALMEQRMILIEDVQKVIAWAEKSGTKLVAHDSGHFLAHHTPTTVTYWVEYSPDADGFTVHNAYSHRMQIMEERKS